MTGKQIVEIAGREVSAYFFGPNRLSEGLNPFTVHPDDVTVEELLPLAEEGVFINPFERPDSTQIFMLKGEQMWYHIWYHKALLNYATEKALELHPEIDIWGECSDEDLAILKKEIDKIKKEFKPWYMH